MLVIVGPSASGKTQMVQELIKKYKMEKLVTYTTRAMRVGEVNGKDYHFISVEEFEENGIVFKSFFAKSSISQFTFSELTVNCLFPISNSIFSSFSTFIINGIVTSFTLSPFLLSAS